MNYYIVTEEIFNTLTKDNISFCLRSIDRTKRLIATIDTVSTNAIDLDFVRGTFEKIICKNIGNDCFDTSESTSQVIELHADNIADKVLSAGENSKMEIEELLALNS